MDNNKQTVSLNSTASIGPDGSSILLRAKVPNNGTGFTVVGSSYGRATWPMTLFFAHGLPVIPWYASIEAKDPWTPPQWMEDKSSYPKVHWPEPQFTEGSRYPVDVSVRQLGKALDGTGIARRSMVI